ncbi:MAG: 3-phosphoshikimate 1-carboxyvinyltransferase [Bacteroidales bacterium]
MKFVSERSSLGGGIMIPASKSHTIRAVAVAAMANGTSILHNPLDSEDARSALKAAGEFGARIKVLDGKWIIEGVDGKINKLAGYIDVANSGTSLRIFSALAAQADHDMTFDGDPSIRQRPMTPLISALQSLGAKVKSQNNRCPFTVRGPLKGGSATVDGISSQFVTALLFTAPLTKDDTEIRVKNLHERSYVEITLDWLRSQQIDFEQDGLEWFKIRGKQKYKAFEKQIPADFSSATFALCAAAVTQSEILIKGLDFGDHQGDKMVFEYLKKMGLEMQHEKEGVRVTGKELNGIEIDMNNTPDALPAMAVVGCFAKGKTRLYNVEQARLKECDRISAIKKELTFMGAKIEELKDGLIIENSKLTGREVHGYNDHRMVMALSIAGLASEGETIVDAAGSVSVTYPSFLTDMTSIGAKIKKIQ